MPAPELEFPEEQTDPEAFHFTLAGIAHQLPSLSLIPSGFYRKSRVAKDVDDRMFMLLEAAASEETLEALDTLLNEQLDGLYVKWAEHQKLSMPDFSKPSTPSPNTQ